MKNSTLVDRENYSIEADGADGEEKPTRARVDFRVPLSSQEWSELHQSLSKYIELGFSAWTFDLRKLPLIYSHDLGMLVSANGTIGQKASKLSVLVKNDSAVEKVLTLTNLHMILKIATD